MKTTIRLTLFAALLFGALLGASAANVKVLQVEISRDGAYYPAATDGVTYIDPSGVATQPISGHATEVARRIAASGVVKLIEVQHCSYYYGRDGLGYLRVNPTINGVYTEIWPKKAVAQVENHSWGGRGGFYLPQYDLEVCQRCDSRAERDNVVVVVALPNKGQIDLARVPLMRLTKNSILVGSASGNHDGGVPHLVTDEEYTSYGCPKVTAAVCLLISDAADAGKAWRWNEIRTVLVDSGDATSFGIPRLNVNAARALWKQRKGF
jgi:hypothetical protein